MAGRVALALFVFAVAGCATPAGGPKSDLGGGGGDGAHVSDGGKGDLAGVRDLATGGDGAGGADLKVAVDMTLPVDLTVPPDLTTPPDLTVPPDMTKTCNGNDCMAACVAQCFVQMKLGIGQCNAGVCNCICV